MIPKWVLSAYFFYVKGKHTLTELSVKYGKSQRTIKRYFDKLTVSRSYSAQPSREKINLIFDATYFGRGYGILVFRADSHNLYWKEIESEKLVYIEECLKILEDRNYEFKSFTIDGRKGVIELLKRLYPIVPIQLCLYHQKAIIRRYITSRPKTECGKDLQKLMKEMLDLNEDEFVWKFKELKNRYHNFLKEKNENNEFKHRRLRSAFRSLRVNMPYLFTSKKHPELNIPNTTNSCDGSFAHLKQKVKIHRGLKKYRRSKMIDFLLNLDSF